MRQKLLTFAAAVHLALVVCGAWQTIPLPQGTLGGSATSFYMAMSGADGYYGFFAPVVDPEVRIRFLVVDLDGQEHVEALEVGATSEANLRLGAVGRLLPTSTPERREQILRSLAAAVLARHPHAKEATVLVESFGIMRPEGYFDVPSMSDHRDGGRSVWLPLQAITFGRPEGS
ncbi:MAG: hypothetical protein H0T47_17410 [Planctomycetaceae bacterium]|nr:hypothetical protein [Planctomycetaceae bacterium]